MDPFTVIALAKSIGGYFFADDEDEPGKLDIANHVVKVAQELTGLSNPHEAIAAIKEDPALQADLQKAMAPIMVAKYQAEASQIESINKTIQTELVSSSLFKSGWRPFYGWITGLCFGTQMMAITVIMIYVVFNEPDKAAQVIAAITAFIGAMVSLWTIALGILGINIAKRSHDKQVSVGQQPTTLMGSILRKVTGR